MKKILICDVIHECGIQKLKKEKEFECVNFSHLSKDELLPKLHDASVIITRSSTDVDERLLNHAKELKAIVRAGVGVDNVDIKECSKRGIIVMNVPTANTIAAVELTMAHLLSTARSFPYAHNNLKNDRIWKRENWYGVELFGKKLGIIGFGNIGSRVAIRAKSFGMDIVAYDPYIPSSKVTNLDMEYTKDFNDILKCDFITIHTPKNKETINMIDADEIAKMKDGVRLVNCARGGLYNEKALFDALKSKKVAFLGIDVFDKEPAVDNKLLELDNVVVTPHLGANTYESQRKISLSAAEQALEAIRGVSYPNALNLPIRFDELPDFTPSYVELIQKMASFAAQINKSPIKSIKLEAKGEIGQYIEPMMTFALVGALNESLGDNVNHVNATFMADERDIKTETKILPSSAYKNLVTVYLSTEKGTTKISGTVFSENEQRIVNINGFKTDFRPMGKLIVFQNTDVPGVIMQISSILASTNTNIADFRLGRDGKGSALAVVLLDEAVDKKTLRKLEDLETCLWVEYAVL